MAQLGDKAKQVQVLFVTVDPERDTQAIAEPVCAGLSSRPFWD